MNDLPTKNTGVIEGSGTKSLYLAGTIPYEVVLQSGDWRPYLVVGEKQFRKEDFMDCVTFSDLSDLEIQEKQQTGVEVNWSDRFIAKLSGTTHQGNYLDKVADTVRLIGLVPEETWPTKEDDDWDSYYVPIPQSVIDKAVKRFILYEGIGIDKASLLYHLKQCPIQITLPAPHPNHAVVLVHIEDDTAYYFDSYPGTTNYLKTINVSLISYALKIVLKGTMSNVIFVHKAGTSEYGFYIPATSEDTIKDKALNFGLSIEKPDHSVDFSKAKEVSGL